MSISQPSYPIRIDNLVNHVGSYVDTKAPTDFTSVADREPLVWDAASSKLIPFARTPTLVSGASELYLPYTTPQTGWVGVNAVRPLHLDAYYRVTDATSGTQNTYQGITSTMNYGVAGSNAPVGTVHNFSARMIISNNGNASNEHCPQFAYLRYENGSTGRAWLTDWNVHGAVGVQQSKLDAMTVFVNNYYNGSPTGNPSGHIWLVTQQGNGGGAAAEHLAATSYPLDVGIGLVGSSGASGAGRGWQTAIQIGGSGSGWGVTTSRIGTGIKMDDWEDYGLYVSSRKSGGTGPAIAVAQAAGPILAGDTTAAFSSSHLEVVTNGSADPLLAVRGVNAADSHSIRVSSGSNSFKIFMAGSADNFLTGTVQGEGGIQVQTAGKRFHVGGTTRVISVTQDNKLGFFAATPVVQQTLAAAATDAATTQTLANSLRTALINLGLGV